MEREMAGTGRGERVAAAMAMRGWRKDAAVAKSLGVNASTVYRWRTTGEFSLEHAIAFCEHFNLSLDWLLLGRGSADLFPPATGVDALQFRVRKALSRFQEELPEFFEMADRDQRCRKSSAHVRQDRNA